MDLTPRTSPEPAVDRPDGDVAAPASRNRRRNGGLAVAAVLLVVVAIGFVLVNGLGSATLYFRNADEAAAQREELGDRRFRLQGVVAPGTVQPDGLGVVFAVQHNGVAVPVRHAGDPPELFQDGIPVVLEGQFQGETFVSDRMMVKHTEEYRAENPGRVADGAP